MADVKKDIRVSVLIPNYNNGRQSSRSGQQDFIGELLQSLWNTLADEPTPLEVIAFDDGSTDDSLETLRRWSKRDWPDGRSFLDLMEAPHCGVLAKTANIMSRRARGDILARLDGDIVCLTPRWVSKLCEVFDRGPQRLGVVGPKQLRSDMRIHAYGDWVLHPNGYTHIGAGLERGAVKHTMEVDHVMGCFYCCKKAVFDDLGGYDEDFLRGQTIDFGMRVRLRGWSCIAVPQIEFVHNHGLRAVRKTAADSAEGVKRSLKVFEDKWGFDRIAPDMDVVRSRYAGTPLLWNKRWFREDRVRQDSSGIGAGASAVGAGGSGMKRIEETDWAGYTRDVVVRKRIDTRVGAVIQLVRQSGSPRNPVMVGAGVGIVPHLLAMQGLSCVAIDADAGDVALAAKCVEGRTYPAGPPRFVHQADAGALPLPDGQTDLLLILDVMELHPNPVVLLREARRVLMPNRFMMIVSRRPEYPPGYDPSDPASRSFEGSEHRYLWHDLVKQVQVVGGWVLAIDPSKDDLSRDMILVARRSPDIQPLFQPAAQTLASVSVE
jgi:GT2 family glycosyltransferase/SAM-dependent methyltransferase